MTRADHPMVVHGDRGQARRTPWRGRRGCVYLATAAFAAAVISARPLPARSCDLDFAGPGAGPHQIARTVDARTLVLADRTELRLASILPPTRFDSPAALRPWPPEDAAVRALEALTAGRAIEIARERDVPDRYGRIPAHVRLTPAAPPAAPGPANQGPANPAAGNATTDDVSNSANDPGPARPAFPLARWLQARLVAGGHARVALTPETSAPCAKALLGHEAAAERDSRGLWTEALYRAKPAGEPRALLAYRSTYQIVAGTIARVAIQRSAIYLNFSEDWQRDFTARIAPGVLKRAGISTDAIKRLEDRPVRVRGWIERRRGPLIIVWRPEQIELLDQAPDGAPRRSVPPLLLSDLAQTATATAVGLDDGIPSEAPPPSTSSLPPNENAPAHD